MQLQLGVIYFQLNVASVSQKPGTRRRIGRQRTYRNTRAENLEHLEHTSLSSLSQHSEKVEVVVEHVEQQRGARRG